MIEVVSHSSYEIFSLYQTLPTISFSPEILSLHKFKSLSDLVFIVFFIIHAALCQSLLWAISTEALASQIWFLCISVVPTVLSIHLCHCLRLVSNLLADISLEFQMVFTDTFLKAFIRCHVKRQPKLQG